MYKKLVISLALCFVLSSMVNAADPNLLGWWKFDDGAGTTAIDSADNPHNGTLHLIQ